MTRPSWTARLSPPPEVQAFTVLHLVLTAVCFGTQMLGSIWRLNIPYGFPSVAFQGWIDLLCFRARFAVLHQAAFFSTDPAFGVHFMYPAPVALLYRIFYAAGSHTLALFFGVTLGLTALLSGIVLREAVRRGLPLMAGVVVLGCAILLGYPFWFEYILGNMEICIFLLVAFGVLAFVTNRGYTAAALFGIATSMKIFPVVFFGLLLSKRKYRQIAFGAAVCAVTTVGSLRFLNPSVVVANRGILSGIEMFRQQYMIQYLLMETGFDHSIFGLIKFLDFYRNAAIYPIDKLLSIYLPCAAIVGLALYVAIIRKLPMLNQILLLTIASILLPSTSHDYTLLHLYVPWALLLLFSLQTSETRPRIKGLMSAFLCFAILLAPESEFIHYGRGFGGQIKCLTLIVLFGIALTCPFQDPAFDPETRGAALGRPPVPA